MREEVGTVLYMPIVLSLIVLTFGHLVEGVFLYGLAFVVGHLIISVLEEEAHQRAICHEGNDPIGFVVSELQATDPYEDDEDGTRISLRPRPPRLLAHSKKEMNAFCILFELFVRLKLKRIV